MSMKSLPSISPKRWIGMMCCSRRLAAIRASRSKRARYSGSAESDPNSSLIATTRS
jgi:regulator of PEP synthase PpsR (kinase-PPPase family)